MTPETLSSRVADHLEDETRAPSFDPVTLAILLAVISSVVEHLVTKCLERIDPAKAKNPGIMARWRLRRLIRRKIAEREQTAAIALYDDGSNADDMGWSVAGLVYRAVLRTGRAMSDEEIAETFGHTQGFAYEPIDGAAE